MTRALRRRHRVVVALLGVATLAGIALALAVRPTLPPLAMGDLPPTAGASPTEAGR